MTIRILLADDHRIVRDGLRSLIEEQEDMAVIGEAANGIKAVELTQVLKPNVVVMDISMPDLNGIGATQQITSSNSNVKIVALSMHNDNRFVAEMLRAGASGYLLKDIAFEELIQAIHAVYNNQTYLSPGIADVVVGEYLDHLQETEHSVFSILTVREREALQLLAEGNSTKEIALALSISSKTVETHRQHIMEKLNIYNVAELTKYAIREGLTSLDI